MSKEPYEKPILESWALSMDGIVLVSSNEKPGEDNEPLTGSYDSNFPIVQ